jgi:hypothetical protein
MYVKNRRDIVRINDGFLQQLEKLEEKLKKEKDEMEMNVK